MKLYFYNLACFVLSAYVIVDLAVYQICIVSSHFILDCAAEIDKFLEESLVMKDLCHPNVMGLIGVCVDADTPYIILPFMEGIAI